MRHIFAALILILLEEGGKKPSNGVSILLLTRTTAKTHQKAQSTLARSCYIQRDTTSNLSDAFKHGVLLDKIDILVSRTIHFRAQDAA